MGTGDIAPAAARMGPAGIGGCRADGSAAKRACLCCTPGDVEVCGMPAIIGNDGIDELYAASHARPLRDWLAARTRSLRPHDGLASCYIGSRPHRARPHAEAGCVRNRRGNRCPGSTPAAQQAFVQATPLRGAQ
ncbi:hypothetical protein XFF6994_1380001 [Xanthomonas citri pv. fuscans]|nr:hypothetical protein XFF6994_1380001 [Xanthomonas citri pv. fuscans]